MRLRGGESGDASGARNVHAAWRMEVARRAAQAYVGNGKLAALAVAGSVGAGVADEFSDMELDCYWLEAPSERDRTDSVDALGGGLTDLWDYDEDEEEWSEEYLLGELEITVSNFLVWTIDRFIDDVVLRADTDPVKHMRLAALRHCCPLAGAPIIESWRERAGRFPPELVSALVERALAPNALAGWAARDALASRGDDVAVGGLLARAGEAVVRATLAINRVYVPHRQLKWQRYLVAGLDIAPDRLAERLEAMMTSNPAGALLVAEGLLNDTVLLAEAHTDADFTWFRAVLSERRRAIEPPSPG